MDEVIVPADPEVAAAVGVSCGTCGCTLNGPEEVYVLHKEWHERIDALEAALAGPFTFMADSPFKMNFGSGGNP
jgi:hypothetical protein